MKYLLSIFFIVASLCVDAQKVNPNEIRVKIYDTILKDIYKQNLAYPNKQIVIDPTINKFQDYKMDEFGLKLDSVKYEKDFKFCGKSSPFKCVEKIEIDRFTLTNVYKNHEDALYPDFYGIYAPIDQWYNLIYYSAVNHFEQPKSFQFSLLIPVRNVRMKDKIMKEQFYFYQFAIDEKFKIIKFEKLFLKP